MRELYEDMIGLPRPSSARKKMSNFERAAQFSPFAALTGYEAVIEETGRHTQRPVELAEDEKGSLDEKMQYLLRHLPQLPMATITYFVPDTKKSGGSYACVSGRVRKVDAYDRLLIMADGTAVDMDAIIDIQV